LRCNTAVDGHAERVLRHFGPDPANWVRHTQTDHDVVVVGGGQAGIGIGFALRRAGIARACVIDAAPPGETGAWTTTARMATLRTPKNWPEPEFGFPELSFQAWYELLHGERAYAEVQRISRLDWAEYLAWIERNVGVPVRHRTRLTDIRPTADHIALSLVISHPGGGDQMVTETTRKLVLATGIEGTGGPYLPPELAGLAPASVAHTGHRIDFPALAGKSIGVLGAAASAFDAAAVALEAGARAVHLFTRRPELIIARGGPQAANVGARDNYHRRSDAERWRQKALAARGGRSVPLESVHRAAAWPGFQVHVNAPWHSARAAGGGVRVEAADGSHQFDFVIAGTGYQYDPASRAELRGIAGEIALWADRYQPPADLADEALGRTPYLGEGYQLLERTPGRAPWAGRIHVFSAAAQLSFGYPVGDVQSLAPGIPRLIDGLVRDLFFEDQLFEIRRIHDSSSARS
jgi:cation diffusion facilitator CzcD-associated flavoprotein CzcO